MPKATHYISAKLLKSANINGGNYIALCGAVWAPGKPLDSTSCVECIEILKQSYKKEV